MSGGRNIDSQQAQSFELIHDSTDQSQKLWARLVKIFGSVDSAPVGLSKDFRVTTFEVGDTEVKIPPSPLADRNFMMVTNKSETDTVYVAKTGVQAGNALGTTSGMDIPPGETSNIAIKSNVEVELYAIAETGKTVILKVVEVA